MITDEDVKKLKTVFATKEDLKKVDQKTDRTIEVLVQTRQEMREMEYRLTTQAQENTQKILEVMDSFAGEIKDHRMKEAIHRHEHEEIVERLENIEKIPVIAHELK